MCREEGADTNKVHLVNRVQDKMSHGSRGPVTVRVMPANVKRLSKVIILLNTH